MKVPGAPPRCRVPLAAAALSQVATRLRGGATGAAECLSYDWADVVLGREVTLGDVTGDVGRPLSAFEPRAAVVCCSLETG